MATVTEETVAELVKQVALLTKQNQDITKQNKNLLSVSTALLSLRKDDGPATKPAAEALLQAPAAPAAADAPASATAVGAADGVRASSLQPSSQRQEHDEIVEAFDDLEDEMDAALAEQEASDLSEVEQEHEQEEPKEEAAEEQPDEIGAEELEAEELQAEELEAEEEKHEMADEADEAGAEEALEEQAMEDAELKEEGEAAVEEEVEVLEEALAEEASAPYDTSCWPAAEAEADEESVICIAEESPNLHDEDVTWSDGDDAGSAWRMEDDEQEAAQQEQEEQAFEQQQQEPLLEEDMDDVFFIDTTCDADDEPMEQKAIKRPPDNIISAYFAKELDRRYAWLCCLFGSKPGYCMEVLVLGYSLIRSGTKHPMVLMHTAEVPAEWLIVLKRTGWELRPVEYLHGDGMYDERSQGGRFEGVFTKLHLFNMTEFEKVVMLDADLLVRQNVDALFNLEPPAALKRHAGGDTISGYKISGDQFINRYGELVSGINAGVMLLRPDADDYQVMLRHLNGEAPRECRNSPMPEQDYLSRYFADRWKALGVEYNYQPHQLAFNGRQGLEFCTRLMMDYSSYVRIVHYSAVPKPRDFLFDVKFQRETEKALKNKFEGDTLKKQIRSKYARDVLFENYSKGIRQQGKKKNIPGAFHTSDYGVIESTLAKTTLCSTQEWFAAWDALLGIHPTLQGMTERAVESAQGQQSGHKAPARPNGGTLLRKSSSSVRRSRTPPRGLRGQARKEDWSCPSCYARVFFWREECFRCAEPRPLDDDDSGGAGDTMSQASTMSPGTSYSFSSSASQSSRRGLGAPAIGAPIGRASGQDEGDFSSPLSSAGAETTSMAAKFQAKPKMRPNGFSSPTPQSLQAPPVGKVPLLRPAAHVMWENKSLPVVQTKPGSLRGWSPAVHTPRRWIEPDTT
mmetsp:Transcript_28600/g.66258  ORF Transcript_28600/g.66258 Transcript_28600/m.66258 type:complete len:911 (-) Transcript_28600:121-2853(-)|eukprot:CAMPEP_0178449048 /NCGR_PEP_ID=MMETSP0689_2-20121128/42325_1 /TAXON_ID=160604 /ORGANISM="Amphidinium massartii, Strain CS-259" /LENGTH=910 /DNA_ID=CAMNT_0020074305 /DNA_START=93 /DNA_END=2825 /DNA_ORIENTATION=-